MLPGADPRRHGPRGGGVGLIAAVFAATLAVYLATAARTVTFGDGGELVTAAWSFAPAHPPGYPLWIPAAGLAARLPLGEPALSAAILSALAAAAACAAVAAWVRRVTGSSAAGCGAGLLLGFSATFWESATTPEVYALHLALTAVLLSGAWEAGDGATAESRGRGFLAAAGALGAGLAHHPTIVVALPAAAIFARPWDRRRRPSGRGAVAAAALVVGIPLVAYASLLGRARASPGAGWHFEPTLAGLLDHATAARFRAYDAGWTAVLDPAGWAGVGRVAWRELGPVALLLALAGCVAPIAGADGERLRRARLGLAALAAATVLFGLRYLTEDRRVYFLPAVLAGAAAAGLALAAIERGWARRGRGAAVVAAAAAAGVLLVAGYGAHDLHAARGAALYARDVLASVPPHGILFAEGDNAFPLAYVTRVLGERTDVTLYDRGGNILGDALADAGIAPEPGEGVADARARAERRLIAKELLSPAPRPIHFMSPPEWTLPPGFRLEPVGLLYRLRRASDPPATDGPAPGALHGEAVADEARRTGDPFAATVAAYYPLLRGERASFLGRPAEAREGYDEALRLAPDSETIRNTLGTIRGRAGDYAAAVREFEAAVRLKPVSPRGWANLATARALAGDPAGAAEARRRLDDLLGR